MPIACRAKQTHGRSYCATDCPADGGIFRFVRVERLDEIPEPDPLGLDVVVLDMNHGWPNLGHDSLVYAVKDAACDLIEPLRGTGLFVRTLSFDVRRRRMVPKPEDGRYSLFLGTGGPGEIDPTKNDGQEPGSQGILEDASWEAPLYRLFDSIQANPDKALLAVCHTFGVLCMWSGVARPTLRGPEKGGKSSGLLENVLTAEGRAHPWFSRLSQELPDGKRLRVVDNRLFDLIPDLTRFDRSTLPLSYETAPGGGAGDSVTMIEWARDRQGVMPRFLGVNHHPEIVDRSRQRLILTEQLERGNVTEEWYRERLDTLTRNYPDEDSDRRLHVTSDYTLLGPLRFHLFRLVRERAQDLGLSLDVHEDRVLEEVDGAALGGLRARGSAGA
jgi:hypothetical protein